MSEGRRSQLAVLLFLAVWFIGAQVVGFWIAITAGVIVGLAVWFLTAPRRRDAERD